MKLYEKKCYAKDLINGKLYANRMVRFVNWKGGGPAGRGDRLEGVFGLLQPGEGREFIIKPTYLIDRNVVPSSPNMLAPSEAAGPIEISVKQPERYVIFCITAISGCDFKSLISKSIGDLREQLGISEESIEGFGEHAVLIEAKPFIDRAVAAIKSKGYRQPHGLVRYYDYRTFNGFLPQMATFLKRNKYRDLREYRFTIDTGIRENRAVILNAGDISDISVYRKLRV